MTYTVNTTKSWSATNNDLQIEFDRWGVKDWETNYPKGARFEGYNQSETDRTVTIRYVKNGKEVKLTMGKQRRAIDNLRVLFLAIESMRLNEKRGIGEILESAYLQLSSGQTLKKTPWEILEIYPGSPIQIAEAAYKVKALKVHPDVGGSESQMQELSEAITLIRENKA